MIAGQAYTVSFWLTNGSGNWYGARGSNNIGVGLTLAPPVQVQHEPLSIVPQIEITSIVHHTTWQRYSFTFTPGQPFQYITIGNFRNDASTSIGVFTSGNGVAYYFLDNVEVVPVAPLAAETVHLHQLESDQEMKLTWHIPDDAAGDVFSLERSLDQKTFLQVEDFGQVTNPGGDMYYTDRDAMAGLQYYYRLRNRCANGDVKYSPVIEAKFGVAGDFLAGNVYPNPARDQFSLDFTALVEGELELQLIDGAGRKVFAENQSLGIGQPSSSYQLPAGLPAGVYQAHFSFEGQSFTQKIIVAGLN